MNEWPAQLAAASIFFFALGIVGVVFAFLVRMTARKTCWLCNTGLLGFFILSVSALVLSIWHSHFR
jgi:hypothetical protein